MNLIPTRVHGMLDYIVGIVLIVSPWLLGFAHMGAATWVPVIVGIMALCYSLLTRYELGLIRVIPMGAHLVLDFCSGLFLLASPWFFGFSHIVYMPHVIIGLIEIGAALLTQHQPHLTDRVSPNQPMVHAH